MLKSGATSIFVSDLKSEDGVIKFQTIVDNEAKIFKNTNGDQFYILYQGLYDISSSICIQGDVNANAMIFLSVYINDAEIKESAVARCIGYDGGAILNFSVRCVKPLNIGDRVSIHINTAGLEVPHNTPPDNTINYLTIRKL